MKDFFKFTFATVTGIILSCVVLFFGGMLILFSALASSEAETQVSSNSVMMLELKGELRERNEAMPYETLFSDDYQVYGLDDILSSIRKAKENENIKGIYLQLSYLTAGYAAIEEIRNTLLDFKESGKFIVAYADNYQQSLYYLASVADKVLMNPKGSLEWRGIASTPIFYKDLLEKIGVEMQIFKVGTYKSAVEPFIATEMSPANREQVTAYINSVWGAVTKAVSESRNVSVDKLNQYADNMIMFEPSEEAVKCGLVDTLIYKNDVRDYLKPLAGLDKDDDLPVLGLQDMVNVRKNQPKDKSGNIVAVYYASGEIVDYESSSFSDQPTIIPSKVIRDLRRLQENDDVKAVVLRVNSPGGSAYGSEQLWYAVSQLKKEKPVIVSMGEYAASGGYYMSCNADTIVAEPTTLTGSIGIFGMYPNVKGLTDKIGLDFDVVKTNAYADFGATGRPMNEGETEDGEPRLRPLPDPLLRRARYCQGGAGQDCPRPRMDGQRRQRAGPRRRAGRIGPRLGDCLPESRHRCLYRRILSGQANVPRDADEHQSGHLPQVALPQWQGWRTLSPVQHSGELRQARPHPGTPALRTECRIIPLLYR